MLGDGGENVDRQAISLREIDRDEIDAKIDQRRNEGDIARQSVQLGDDQSCTMKTAKAQRFSELGTVVALAGFDLHDLGGEVQVPPFRYE